MADDKYNPKLPKEAKITMRTNCVHLGITYCPMYIDGDDSVTFPIWPVSHYRGEMFGLIERRFDGIIKNCPQNHGNHRQRTQCYRLLFYKCCVSKRHCPELTFKIWNQIFYAMGLHEHQRLDINIIRQIINFIWIRIIMNFSDNYVVLFQAIRVIRYCIAFWKKSQFNALCNALPNCHDVLRY